MPRETPPPPVTWVEADLLDTAFTVQEHHDGMFTIDVPDDRIVLSAEQLRPIAEGFIKIADAKGWGHEPDAAQSAEDGAAASPDSARDQSAVAIAAIRGDAE